MPALNELATKPFDNTQTYGDVVHFVHVMDGKLRLVQQWTGVADIEEAIDDLIRNP